MKKLITIIFLIPFICFSQIKPDKYYHAGAGMVLSAGMYTIGQYSYREMNPIAPSLIAMTGGFTKEMFDCFNTGKFSGKDMLWTTASGIVVNAAMALIWKRKKGKHKKIEFIEFDLTKK